jgi:hypothetical protein
MNKFGKSSSTLVVNAQAASSLTERLLPGQVEAIDHGKGKHILCTAGRLWVTLEHEGWDHILEQNDSLDIDEDGVVVISALNTGAFMVEDSRAYQTLSQ